ncbi:hypothetical protein [Prosthecobacter sp.]|uniref:hypothetical protein n=1 Tax=Prosthecobacter sp. TaxID=1965333 RepID=UPI003784137B
MKTTLAVLASLVLIALAIGGLTPFFGDSASRIHREHGLTLPASVSGIECRGDAWMRICSDCGAASSFEIPVSDLPVFLSQLRVIDTDTTSFSSIFPRNPQYRVKRSWMSGRPTATYHCSSPTADGLSVQTWTAGPSSVGVCLYTDWN